MRLIRRLQYLIHHRRRARELAEELAYHRQMTEAEHRALGLSEKDARDSANRLMGNETLAREDAAGVWVATWVQSIYQDLRYAGRSLKNQPGFTLLALLALVLGIGLNTSLFTVFNAVAIRPWPVRDPERMVNLAAFSPRYHGYAGFSVAEYRYLSGHSRTLTGAILERSYRVNLDQQMDGPRSAAHFVSGNYFNLLGADLALGRGFIPDEDRVETPQAVAVISYSIWQSRYGGDPDILGRKIRVDDLPFLVIGVAGKDFSGSSPDRHDLWAPLASLPLARPSDPSSKTLLTDPNYCCSTMHARLAPGVTREQARAELTTLSVQFATAIGKQPHDVAVFGTQLLGRPDGKRKALPIMALLLAAVGSILLLACSNVSNLLLARASARQREIAVRLAIGAGRFRIVRQLLTESLLLAALASGLGLLLAYVLPEFVFSFFVQEVTSIDLTPDPMVLAYSVGIAVLSAVAFGLAPALHGTRISESDAMKQQSTHVSSRFPLRGLLLGVQVAISVTLLVGAGLLLRGLSNARSLDPGFNVNDVRIITVDLPVNSYNALSGRGFFDQLVSQVQSVAGSSPVGIADIPPLSNSRNMTGFRLPGQQADGDTLILLQRVNAGYFEVLGIPLIAGRNFVAEDRERRSIIINESMARRYWPGTRAVGQAILDGRLQPREVVGVVRDSQVYGIGPVEPMFFESFGGHQHAVLLTPGAVASAAADVIRRSESRAVVTTAPMSDQLNRWLRSARASATLASALGLLALLLATVGVYGVIAYSVQQRRWEIGVRMALGAKGGEVVRLILRRNARPVLCGLAIGLAASIAGSKLLESSLYGVSRFDPLAYAGVFALLLAAGIASSVIPARRATQTDAAVALRHE